MAKKVNDNKTIREESIKKLIDSIVKIDTNSLSHLEKTILIETLVNGKSFFELNDRIELSSYRQKIILENAVTKLNNNIQQINDKLKILEESQKELAELRYWKQLLEANIKKENEIDPELKRLLSLDVQDAGFSNRVLQIFFNNEIYNVGDIVKYSKRNMSKFRNCGKNSIKEIEIFLDKNGLSWGMKM